MQDPANADKAYTEQAFYVAITRFEAAGIVVCTNSTASSALFL
jgi:hypothetical protein